MRINKQAGFWLRLLSRLIDLLIVIIVISITMYLSVDKKNKTYVFKQDYLFYVWSITSAYFMLFFTTLLPMINKGKTIGNFITRTKVETNNKIVKSVFYRELFFGVSWTTLLLLFSIILTPKIFAGVMTKDSQIIYLNNFDQFRFAFINTISGVVIFIQLIMAISILIKKKEKSIIDSLSQSRVIRINVFITKPKEKSKIEIKPKMVNNVIVEWIKEK